MDVVLRVVTSAAVAVIVDGVAAVVSIVVAVDAPVAAAFIDASAVDAVYLAPSNTKRVLLVLTMAVDGKIYKLTFHVALQKLLKISCLIIFVSSLFLAWW